MTRTLLKARQLVTMDSASRIFRGGGILISGPFIERVLDQEELKTLGEFPGEVVHAERLTVIPGFVQTHVHLCQTLFRGLADDLDLLDWLQKRIFPLEAAHSPSSMRASALAGLSELICSGTTTIMDMGSLDHEEEIVRAIDETGIRAFVGRSMMDVNDLYPPLRQTTEAALKATLMEAERWHGFADGRIRYAVAPRFVLACSESMLKEAYAMTRAFPGMLFHTHASEQKRELEAVRARCGMDNIEYFNDIGVLQANTCLAHCVWVSDTETVLLRRSDAKVLHCPSANLKLGSGIAPIPEFLNRGVTVSLGADGAACNNTMNMFQEMRLAGLIQKPLHGADAVRAQSVLEMATRGGAVTLGLGSEIGSIEAGKRADLVLLDLDRLWNPVGDSGAEEIYSSIVYSSSAENVRSVMVDGRWLYRDGVFATLDPHRVRERGREELEALMNRKR